MSQILETAVPTIHYALDHLDKEVREQLRRLEQHSREQHTALLQAQMLLHLHLPDAERHPGYQQIQKVLQGRLHHSDEDGS